MQTELNDKGSLRLFLAAITGLFLAPTVWAFIPLDRPVPEHIDYPQGAAPSSREVNLGRTLFFDPRLSFNQTQSCATCHNPQRGWGDGQTVSQGARGNRLSRNTPPLYNLAWNELFFWDGRAKSLEEQALAPITSPDEMNQPLDQLLPKLQGVPYYRQEFQAVYGSQGITAETLAQALAAFERSLIVNDTALDRFVQGDQQALTPAQQRGKQLFEGKARCVKCHDGANLTDGGFHNLGLKGPDPGRQAVTQDATLQGAFKTPSLRNAALTAPYMHDGSLLSLEQVIEFYDRGGDERATADSEMQPLKLSKAEQADLQAFLQALTQELVIHAPQLP